MKKVFQIKLKNITRVFALVIAVSLVTFTGCKSYDEDIANLETDIAALKTELTTLNTTTKAATDAQIAALTAEINTLKTKVTTLESTGATDAEVAKAITDAKADIMSKTASIEALNAYKTINDAAIAAINIKLNGAATQADVDALKARVATLESTGATDAEVAAVKAELNAAIAALNTKVNAAATKVELDAAKADLNTQITAVKTTLTALGADVTAITAKVTGLTADVAKLTTDLGKVKGDVEARLAIIEGLLKISAGKSTVLDGFTTQLADQLAKITANTSAITALQTSLTAEKAKIVTLQADVAKDKADIAALQTSVTSLQASITKINDNLKVVANAMSLNFSVLSSRLSSLVFISEMFVNGIESMNFSTISYLPCTSSIYKYIVPKYTVKYHVNPSFITAADIETNNLGFVVNKSTNIITSYYSAAAAGDSRIKANFISLTNGILTVDVAVQDFDALLGTVGGNTTSQMSGSIVEKFSMVALQVPLSEKAVKDNKLVFDANNVITIGNATFPAGRVVTSDYARLYYKNMVAPTDVYLAKKGLTAPTHKLALTVASAQGQAVEGVDGATSNHPLIIELPFNTSLNLVDNIEIHNAINAISTERYGLSYKFDLLNENGAAIVYNRGSNSTDQQKFIEILDPVTGKIEAKTFSLQDIVAAQGRTPIVRVLVFSDKDASCPVFMAFVKIHIADKPAAKPITIDPNPFTFSVVADPACGDYTSQITVTNMNEKVYTQAGLSKTTFHAIYNQFTTSGDGTLVQGVDPQEVDSYVINWTLSNALVWSKLFTAANGTYTFTAQVVYKSQTPSENPNVIINLSKTFTRSTFNIPVSQLIQNYWYNSYTNVKHSIQVPQLGETTTVGPNSFANNINEAFEQNTTSPYVKYLKVFGTTEYNYYFTASQPAISNGTGTTTLYASADGQTLRVGSPTGSEIVATINPFASGAGDVMVLNYNSPTAKTLLNVDKENLKARIGLKTVWCNNTQNPLSLLSTEPVRPVTVNGKDYFDVFFIRPINSIPNTTKYFVDGLDFNARYTYLQVDSLLDLADWRNGAGNVSTFALNNNYYSYYGVTAVAVNVAAIKTDLNQAAGVKVPLTNYPSILVKNETSIPGVIAPAINYGGYITYKNNSTALGIEFNLYVPVTVTYYWGTVTTEIKVPVKKTVGPSGVKRK